MTFGLATLSLARTNPMNASQALSATPMPGLLMVLDGIVHDHGSAELADHDPVKARVADDIAVDECPFHPE